MRCFVLLADPNGKGIPSTFLRRYEALPRARGWDFAWRSFCNATVLTAWDDPWGDPLIAHDGQWIAVGVARLDNRPDVQRWVDSESRDLTDLELILRVVAEHGTKYVPQLLGDFAFVSLSTSTGTIIGVCDPFRVKQLYYAKWDGLFAFASRAEALAVEDRYEAQYLAERVANCSPTPELTVYAGIKTVPAGTMAILERRELALRRYWSPDGFAPDGTWVSREREAAETLRDLLAESVRLRLSGNGSAWAQLSGGLDSSSVVSVTQWLLERGTVAHGLDGTVTYVDREGTSADERRYSDAVVQRWRLRNEAIVDPPLWHEEHHALPRIDQPRSDLMFYPREYRLSRIVRAAGGRVLLTGQGPDEFLSGNMLFFADWISRGRIGMALREMARRAAIGRVSFWALSYRNAVLPLLPRAARLRLGRDETELPRWVSRAVARRYDLHERAFEMLAYAGRIGQKYHHAIVTGVAGIGKLMDQGILGDTLDVRHPFLYRPLVQFALQLPPELCTRPYARKWILREAMREILPEAVRTRVGKGSLTERYAWSLTAQRQLLEPLVRDSILASLGVVDEAQLRTAFDTAAGEPGRRSEPHATLQGVLVIEAWLQMRAGRWPRGNHSRNVRLVNKVSTGYTYSPSA
jgi:asparagine synthase (glutamine-hydrolysing)